MFSCYAEFHGNANIVKQTLPKSATAAPRVHNPQECATPDQSLYGGPLGGIPSLRHFWSCAMSHADEFFQNVQSNLESTTFTSEISSNKASKC